MHTQRNIVKILRRTPNATPAQVAQALESTVSLQAIAWWLAWAKTQIKRTEVVA